MEKFFDIANKPRIEGTDTLYFRDGDTANTYFNYIPYSKIEKYTDITKVSTINNSVFVESKAVNPVNCAIIFCTYKREEFIKRNVSYLVKKLREQSEFSCKIIVTDNGRTLLKKDFDDDVILIENINSGGSGGFKRGMEEAARIGVFTHFILMDDDVEIDFVSVQKMLNFLRFLKPEYKDLAIAGSMLYLDKPTFQFEAGGRFEKDGSQHGFGHFLDLSKSENLTLNEQENDINYGGWWFMCMPFKYIEEGNFPLPFFLKYDDVEYALRCNLKIITLNGVGVWHSKFEDKYNTYCEYYNTRNYLHLCEKYCTDFNESKARRFVKKRIKAKRKRQQYQMIKAIEKGYEDYLKGIGYLYSLNSEGNHNEICKLNYEYLTYEEIEEKCGVKPQPNHFYAPPGKRKILQALIPKKYVITDCFHDKPIQYLTAKAAIHCDGNHNRAYITKRISNKEMPKI